MLSSNHVLFYLFFFSFIFNNFHFFIFQRFSTPPNIFVTAGHQIPKKPQDAMAMWVEELRVDDFKICFREAKIFDGPHKNIKIVSELDINFLPLDNSLFLPIHKITFTLPNYKSKLKEKSMSSCLQIHVFKSVRTLSKLTEVNRVIAIHNNNKKKHSARLFPIFMLFKMY